MKHLAGFRWFADNYQFYIADLTDPGESLATLCDEMIADPKAHKRNCARGYSATTDFISVCTRAHQNVHWLDVFDGKPSAKRASAPAVEHRIPLDVRSGQISLGNFYPGDPIEAPIFYVPAGKYEVTVRGFNLGVEVDEMYKLTDEDLEKRRDLERYEIYLVRKGDCPASDDD